MYYVAVDVLPTVVTGALSSLRTIKGDLNPVVTSYICLDPCHVFRFQRWVVR